MSANRMHKAMGVRMSLARRRARMAIVNPRAAAVRLARLARQAERRAHERQ